MGKSIFSELALNFLFPHRCVFCRKVILPDQKICPNCRSTAVRVDKDACPLCGMPKKMCQCAGKTDFYDMAASVYLYDEMVRSGILHYKNGGNRRSVRFFAEEMAECFYRKSDFPIDYIAYIPHTKREIKEKGFDQNREIAEALSEIMHIPVYDKFVKLYETSPQKAIMHRYKKGNVAGVFDLSDPESAKGKRFLLTDDIKTTGATLNECAKILKLYDADRIFALTFALAVPDKEKSSAKNTQNPKKP